jgi:hypothetical protein
MLYQYASGAILEATFDRTGAEGCHKDNRPSEPHDSRTNGLPSATMDKVREEIVKLF